MTVQISSNAIGSHGANIQEVKLVINCQSLDEASCLALDEGMQHATRKKQTRFVVLDGTEMRNFNARICGILASLARRLGQRGGRAFIFGLDEQCEHVLRVTHLDRLIGVCASRQEALQIINKHNGAARTWQERPTYALQPDDSDAPQCTAFVDQREPKPTFLWGDATYIKRSGHERSGRGRSARMGLMLLALLGLSLIYHTDVVNRHANALFPKVIDLCLTKAGAIFGQRPVVVSETGEKSRVQSVQIAIVQVRRTPGIGMDGDTESQTTTEHQGARTTSPLQARLAPRFIVISGESVVRTELVGNQAMLGPGLQEQRMDGTAVDSMKCRFGRDLCVIIVCLAPSE